VFIERGLIGFWSARANIFMSAPESVGRRRRHARMARNMILLTAFAVDVI